MKMPTPIVIKFAKLVIALASIAILGTVIGIALKDQTLLYLSGGVALLASGVPSHILSGITDHFLSENREPINEFLDCQQPRLANCLFLCCHRLNSLNLASLH